MDHNRSRVEIIGQILETATGGGTTKTMIICDALLSYNQLNEYLTILIESDLLRYDDQTHTFKTTEKGLRFLNFYNEICDVLTY